MCPGVQIQENDCKLKEDTWYYTSSSISVDKCLYLIYIYMLLPIRCTYISVRVNIISHFLKASKCNGDTFYLNIYMYFCTMENWYLKILIKGNIENRVLRILCTFIRCPHTICHNKVISTLIAWKNIHRYTLPLYNTSGRWIQFLLYSC